MRLKGEAAELATSSSSLSLLLSALFLAASRQNAKLGGRRGIALLWERARGDSRVQTDGGDGVDGVVCWLARYGFPVEQSELGEVHADDLCLCVCRSLQQNIKLS